MQIINRRLIVKYSKICYIRDEDMEFNGVSGAQVKHKIKG